MSLHGVPEPQTRGPPASCSLQGRGAGSRRDPRAGKHGAQLEAQLRGPHSGGLAFLFSTSPFLLLIYCNYLSPCVRAAAQHRASSYARGLAELPMANRALSVSPLPARPPPPNPRQEGWPVSLPSFAGTGTGLAVARPPGHRHCYRGSSQMPNSAQRGKAAQALEDSPLTLCWFTRGLSLKCGSCVDRGPTEGR